MKQPAASGNYYDIVVEPDSSPGRPGAGTVHHIAFRTHNDATEIGWHSALSISGFAVTDVRDRKYFRSIYFRAPENVLFEIATDPPGFAVDESLNALGSSLKLPDQYETMRAEIEQRLPTLRSPMYRHVSKPARAAN
jgi:glyoxalase family protein